MQTKHIADPEATDEFSFCGERIHPYDTPAYDYRDSTCYYCSQEFNRYMENKINDKALTTVDGRPVRTWKELAQYALDVQNASNLSGVVHSFSRVITEVRARLDFEATTEEGKKFTTYYLVNDHPVCIMFADKIASLTYVQNVASQSATDAYKWATKILDGQIER